MSSTVRIAWGRNFDNKQRWNDVCAWTVERFGLPGDRFQSHANVEFMDFVFKSNKDALMFAIEHNGIIVPEEHTLQ